MKVSRATSAEDYKLLSGFEAARKILLDQRFADRLEKPLAYWALPNDRRLPLAFLGLPLGQLLNTPFEELSSTPGIGQKKISTLVKLLHRAAQEEPPSVPFGISELGAEGNGRFDPSTVSEAFWAQWRTTVRKHNLGHEKLGRLTPTLQGLPTVIWHTPLAAYLDHDLEEIRQLKTHGEKRVTAVLEIFYHVHRALQHAQPDRHLVVQLLPSFIPPLEAWIRETLAATQLPSSQDLRLNLTLPLLNQIEIDGGATVHRLAAGRLGIETKPQSVREQSMAMGVTRARVYQLLEQCSKIMEVRWPEASHLLSQLREKIQREEADLELLQQFDEIRFLFYPDTKQQPVEEVLIAQEEFVVQQVPQG